jgi:hypothetical protein
VDVVDRRCGDLPGRAGVGIDPREFPQPVVAYAYRLGTWIGIVIFTKINIPQAAKPVGCFCIHLLVFLFVLQLALLFETELGLLLLFLISFILLTNVTHDIFSFRMIKVMYQLAKDSAKLAF